MAEAAQAWLERLDDAQLPTAPWAGPARRRQRGRTPAVVLHADRSRRACHAPAAARAAARGDGARRGRAFPGRYVTVATIMGLENVLDRVEGFTARFDRERGRDPGLYYLRVFGAPGDAGAWGYRFGGHHVSLNNLVVDGELVAATPCFMGADPAVSPVLGGAANRPVARAEDLARELVRSLPPQLRQQAVLLPRGPSRLFPPHRPPCR